MARITNMDNRKAPTSHLKRLGMEVSARRWRESAKPVSSNTQMSQILLTVTPACGTGHIEDGLEELSAQILGSAAPFFHPPLPPAQLLSAHTV